MRGKIANGKNQMEKQHGKIEIVNNGKISRKIARKNLIVKNYGNKQHKLEYAIVNN